MTAGRITVALILGSTREGRFGETVARWASAKIGARSDMTVELIDPLEIDFPKRHEKEPGRRFRRCVSGWPPPTPSSW